MREDKFIYLDNASTSFPKPKCVVDSINHSLLNFPLNVNRRGFSSRNDFQIEEAIEETRSLLKNMIHAQPVDHLIFSLNATECANIILKELIAPNSHLIISSFEHSAISRTVTALSKNVGASFDVLYPDSHGKISLEKLKEMVKPNTKMIMITYGSNVTGDILYEDRFGEFATANRILMFSDLSQAIGNIPLDVGKSKIDMAIFSGHKSLMGPPGVGMLYVKKDIPFHPFRYGGLGFKSENDLLETIKDSDYETGTPNSLGILGLRSSLKFLEHRGWESVFRKKENLIQSCISRLKEIDGLVLYGNRSSNPRLPILSFNVAGKSPVNLVAPFLDSVYHIQTRAGLHCSPWSHKSLGTFPEGTVRLSFGFFSSIHEIERLEMGLRDIVKMPL